MLSALNEFLTKWEGLWLFIVLLSGLIIEFHSNYMLRLEYNYDYEKDEAKKRRKTRTTKKTTTDKAGTITVEESQEVTEPIAEEKK